MASCFAIKTVSMMIFAGVVSTSCERALSPTNIEVGSGFEEAKVTEDRGDLAEILGSALFQSDGDTIKPREAAKISEFLDAFIRSDMAG
jgi:hypothetical protein